MNKCEICGVEVKKKFKHHVTPRCKGGRKGVIVKCCYTCNGQVHMLFTEKELAKMTFEELLTTKEMREYIKWRRKHPTREFRHRMSNKVKRGR